MCVGVAPWVMLSGRTLRVVEDKAKRKKEGAKRVGTGIIKRSLRTLRVMRSSNKVALELPLEQFEVCIVHFGCHGRPNLRVHVVPVVAVQLHSLAVNQYLSSGS